MTLTKKEMDLLDLAYTDGERIRKGELFDYQIKALEQLRSCISYLELRYPAYDFDYTYFEPMTQKREYTEVTFVETGFQTEYTVRLEYKDGKEILSDNFYDVPLEKAYDKGIEDMLKFRGIRARVYTVFPYLLSEKITSVFELTGHKPPLGRITEIFIVAEFLPDYASLNEMADQIEKIFKENSIYSSGTLYYVTDMDNIKEMDILKLDEYVRDRKNIRNIRSTSFRAFGI